MGQGPWAGVGVALALHLGRRKVTDAPERGVVIAKMKELVDLARHHLFAETSSSPCC
jgi:hypothetical protein